jgi:hypothetical protein
VGGARFSKNSEIWFLNNLLCKVIFSRQNSLFQNTKEKFDGKKMTLEMNEVLWFFGIFL